MVKRTAVNWVFFTVGLMILALGISMMIKGRMMGVGPWDVLAIGLFKNFGLTIGTWSILIGLAIVAVTMGATRKIPKLGTVLNMVLIGVFIDIFNFVLPDIQSFAGQIVIFVAGLFVYAYGIGLYVSPQMGAGPRDGLMLFLVERSGLSIRTVRSIIEVTVAVLGWLLGGPVGAGTVIVAFGTGLIAQQSIPQCRALLERVLAEKGGTPPAVRF
ncbi:YczE/YyaS/YitT family protein [Indiicoccus explosivorum]|uniref:YczE/YyaS/YitT family protein n=1 Tax=Indiicoccus explosivorum TaxID=1917864 RepID=UPI001F4E1169|nr:YitT family protein [Indiicoccus explosivorum]